MSEHKLPKQPKSLRERQGYFNGIADEITDKLEANGVIVIVQDQQGSIGLVSKGVNHSKAVELLAIGIHQVLGKYDEAVSKATTEHDAQTLN